MPPIQLQDIQAAIHKSAAGKQGQGSPQDAVRAGGAPAAVAQDLAVMADQAIQYSKGQAAGNAQAEVERKASAEGLATERAQSDTARAETLEAQRREMLEIEVARRSAEQQAQLAMAADAQRVALERAEAAERTTQARMQREIQARELAERAAAKAKEAEAEREAERADSLKRSVLRRYSPKFAEVFGGVAEAAATFEEARDYLDVLQATQTDWGPKQVNRQALESELAKLYGRR